MQIRFNVHGILCKHVDFLLTYQEIDLLNKKEVNQK